MNKIITGTKTILLAIVLSFGLSYALAWTAPSTTPPTGNVSAPINTGTGLQQKAGDLTVKGLVADTLTVGTPVTAGAITAPKFCIGTSCITAWTQAGGSLPIKTTNLYQAPTKTTASCWNDGTKSTCKNTCLGQLTTAGTCLYAACAASYGCDTVSSFANTNLGALVQ